MKSKRSQRRTSDTSTIPSFDLIKTLLIALGAAQALFLFLLFLAVLVSPLYESVIKGFSVRGVLLYILLLVGATSCWLSRRRRFSPQQKPDDTPKLSFWETRWPRFVFLCLFLVFVEWFVVSVRLPYRGGLVRGNDAPQYYAHLHSWVFDRDMNFENEYQMIPGIGKQMEKNYPEIPGWNVAPIGTAILWLPFYLLAHVSVSLLRWRGADVVADGISSPYAAGVAFGSIFLVWMGMLMVYATLGRRFSKRTAFFTTLLLWCATPIPYYLTTEPWMSHACSFFAGALVFFVWEKKPEQPSTAAWILLGASIGLAMLVRPSHFVLLLLPLLDMALQMPKAERQGTLAREMGLCLVAAFLLFSPQLITWWFRSGLRSPPGNPIHWSHPAIVNILFSARSGLFAWHPITLLGFLGVPLLWKHSRNLGLSVGLVLLADIYMNTAVGNWWGGDSFGMRRFVGTLPFIAPGVAASGSWAVALWKRKPIIPITFLVLLLAIHNALLLVQHRDNWFQPGRPVSFQNIFSSSAALFHSYFGNPFSYPANLWFAAKYHVSPAQYDVVGGADPTDKHELDVQDAFLRPYLGEGWEVHFKTSFLAQPFAVREQHCSLLLPLKKGEAYEVELLLSPPPDLGNNQVVSLFLNGHEVGEAEIQATGQTNVKAHLKETFTRDGVNVLELTFTYLKTKTDLTERSGLEVKARRFVTGIASLHRLKVQSQSPKSLADHQENE